MSRKLRKKILGDSLIWVIIAAFVVIMLFPFVYILSTALKSDTDLATSVGRIFARKQRNGRILQKHGSCWIFPSAFLIHLLLR